MTLVGGPTHPSGPECASAQQCCVRKGYVSRWTARGGVEGAWRGRVELAKQAIASDALPSGSTDERQAAGIVGAWQGRGPCEGVKAA